MPINDGLPYLPAFVAAAEAGTFSEAAKRLKMTQSAISKQIIALERNLGAVLFDRLPRQLVLTEAGEALAPVARVLLTELAQVGDSIAAQQSRLPQGPIRIGTSETIGAHVLPQWLRRLVDQLPAVQPLVHVDTDEHLLEGLQQGRLDLLVMAGTVYPDVLEGVTLASDPLRLVAAPEVVARLGVGRPLTEMTVPLVIPDLDQGWRQRLEAEIFEPLGWRPEIGWVVNPLEVMKRFVRAGLGVTILPQHAVAEDLAAGHLVMVETATPLPVHAIDMVKHRHRRAGRVLEAVWETLAGIGP
jgi:DNA-binding transcriptional LysR family regulator